MLLLPILIGIAAFILGWALIPVFSKVASLVKASAEQSQVKAKAGKDYELPFHELFTPEYKENHHFAGHQREPYYIFIPLALAILINNRFFWTLFIVILNCLFWQEIIKEIFHFIGFLFEFVFGGGAEKKK